MANNLLQGWSHRSKPNTLPREFFCYRIDVTWCRNALVVNKMWHVTVLKPVGLCCNHRCSGWHKFSQKHQLSGSPVFAVVWDITHVSSHWDRDQTRILLMIIHNSACESLESIYFHLFILIHMIAPELCVGLYINKFIFGGVVHWKLGFVHVRLTVKIHNCKKLFKKKTHFHL